jgi:NADH dehydrogenase
VSISDLDGLVDAFAGCDAVAHCAGVNRELGAQTYEAVHVQGTANVVQAAEKAGVRRLAYVSFLRARPDCGSAYHESKWAAEEIVRASSCEWTIIKPGMMFGRGDHMLDHLSHALYTFPIFLGIGQGRVRPLAVEDCVTVLTAALVEDRLVGKTVGLGGPTEIGFDDAARLVASVIGKKCLFLAVPIPFHYAMARAAEASMSVPLISLAQVRNLEEEVVEPLNAPDALPAALVPTTAFDELAIRSGLPAPGPFRLADLRWFGAKPPDTTDRGDALLIYDGDCGFCTTAARWAAKGFRRGERIEAWQLLDESELAALGLRVDDVQEAAWWIDTDGSLERGHRAAGRALEAADGWRRLIGTMMLAPPTSWLAAVVYRVVVRYRYRLSGVSPACAIARDPAARYRS